MTMLILDTELKRRIFQALQLKHALGLYQQTGFLVTRGATPRRMLDAVTATTGKRYANSEKGRHAAIIDLIAYLESHAHISLGDTREEAQ